MRSAHTRIAARHLFGEVLGINTSDGEAGHCKRTQALGGKEIALASAKVFDHARRSIEEALVDTRSPYIGGLDNVGIGGKNSLGFHRRGLLPK
jgi:hypothetical protein